GRVLSARQARRSFPNGQRAALPARPDRRGDRVDPQLRSRLPAHGLQGPGNPPASRARIPHGRGGAKPVPPQLPRPLRRRPLERAPGAPSAHPLPELAVERRAADPLHRLKAFLAETPARMMLLAESPGRRETLSQHLAEYGLRPEPCAGFEEFRRSESRLALGVAPLLAGFFLDSEALCFVTESELYAGTARSRAARDRKAVSSIEGMLRDLSELGSGDPGVHVQHGIGRYRGLVDLDLGEGAAEFL